MTRFAIGSMILKGRVHIIGESPNHLLLDLELGLISGMVQVLAVALQMNWSRRMKKFSPFFLRQDWVLVLLQFGSVR
jgi:hypothetical protein